jgi:hypothetical protein
MNSPKFASNILHRPAPIATRRGVASLCWRLKASTGSCCPKRGFQRLDRDQERFCDPEATSSAPSTKTIVWQPPRIRPQPCNRSTAASIASSSSRNSQLRVALVFRGCAQRKVTRRSSTMSWKRCSTPAATYATLPALTTTSSSATESRPDPRQRSIPRPRCADPDHRPTPQARARSSG